MAGDWIKMRADLFAHPKVFSLAEHFAKDEMWVVGALFAFWAWADKHCVDGRVDGATSRLVDRATRVDGLAAALVSVGWLQLDDAGITIPNFGEHNGDSAKERSLKNQRQARWREKQAGQNVDGKASTRPSTEASTREEKRREEKKEEQESPPSKKVSKAKRQSFTDWANALASDAIAADDKIFGWAQTVGIPREWIAIAWWIFEARYEDADTAYSDWRAVFRKAVREDWLKAWRQTRTGDWELTTAGIQAQREMANA